MCSVVEIKNESEYYIHYHSPESLETLPSAKESLEYQHLFQVSSITTEASQHNSLIPTSSLSDIKNKLNCDSAREKDKDFLSSDDKDFLSSEDKNVLSSDDKDFQSSEDKDFSLEEMINYESRDKPESGEVDLEITEPAEEACNDDDDDNPDTRTNNQQNCENLAGLRMSTDRKLKGLYISEQIQLAWLGYVSNGETILTKISVETLFWLIIQKVRRRSVTPDEDSAVDPPSRSNSQGSNSTTTTGNEDERYL